jgi:hypothetical protein
MARKLRILCLHGTETTAEIMQWQLRTFQQTYGDLLELHYVDAPHETGRPRYRPFRERGFKAPYRKWLELERDVFYKTEDRFDLTYTEELAYLVQQSIVFLVDLLNRAAGEPFDGLLGFS